MTKSHPWASLFPRATPAGGTAGHDERHRDDGAHWARASLSVASQRTRPDANAPVGQECAGEPAPWRPAGTAQSRHHASRGAGGCAGNRCATETSAPRRVEGEIEGGSRSGTRSRRGSAPVARLRQERQRPSDDRQAQAAKGIARQRTHECRTEFRAATGDDPEGIGPRREAQILETQHCGSTTTQAPGISGWGASQEPPGDLEARIGPQNPPLALQSDLQFQGRELLRRP